MPDSVCEQITDSVTQTNTKTVAETPAMAMSNFIMATNTAVSNSNHNATAAQQQGQMLMQAATTQGINAINAIGTASISKAAEAILEK
ncbi:glycerol-3-phosphate dehydrogenase subunit C [Vibrio pectenicida]|uniref:Glycerol-3-phosphate dehydrogenase subunit C n=1 Tax=Vibrio pectenicida TaxID=62763 RepID=A0A427TYS1_9VIBR|nr:RebB family R body protein [Vibrio pectenicida]NOH72719.1 glycerol-3-phosphate dehydrogenase subunit C [Vibrio pectenicida]RSD29669.1 glycerol-3-phosphate dehydrogenase subunit C [Vibrio pectenicida]